jgi:hypothetical protein
MRPITKTTFLDANGLAFDKDYDPYGDAKDDLILNLGKYCSFCEVAVPPRSSLEVEHVKNKNGYPQFKFKWSNFLLGCKNCNTIKGTKDFQFNKIHLPHLNNTFLSFKILDGGLITVNPTLSATEKAKAKLFSELIGIERRPGFPQHSSKDDRWQNRLQVWNLAMRYLPKYQNNQIDLDTLCDLALTHGFFSVWMTVFVNHTDVKKELITIFVGTAKDCFDNQANPKPRNGLFT